MLGTLYSRLLRSRSTRETRSYHDPARLGEQLTAKAKLLRASGFLDYPAIVHLETRAVCNAACSFCPYDHLDSRVRSRSWYPMSRATAATTSRTATGVVAMCCMDGESRYPKRDARTQHILEIYNQPHLRALRQSLPSRRETGSPCAGCTHLSY